MKLHLNRNRQWNRDMIYKERDGGSLPGGWIYGDVTSCCCCCCEFVFLNCIIFLQHMNTAIISVCWAVSLLDLQRRTEPHCNNQYDNTSSTCLIITITTCVCAHGCIFAHVYFRGMITSPDFSPLFPVTEKSFLPPRRAITSDWLSHPGTGRRYANEALTKRLMGEQINDVCVCVCVYADITALHFNDGEAGEPYLTVSRSSSRR